MPFSSSTMYAYIFLSVSGICFFGALISLVTALTGEPVASDSNWLHWKNAAIFGAIAPLCMLIAIRLFFGSSSALEIESEEDRERRLTQQKREALEFGKHAIVQGAFVGCGACLMLLGRGVSPFFSLSVGGGCVGIGIVVLLVSLNKHATDLGGMLLRAFFVLIVASQVALAFVVLVLITAVKFGFVYD